MLLTAFHGFCMALADSVPGVSGGTIAFILGFYDRFMPSRTAPPVWTLPCLRSALPRSNSRHFCWASRFCVILRTLSRPFPFGMRRYGNGISFRHNRSL